MSLSSKEIDNIAEKVADKLKIQFERPLSSTEAKEILKISSDSALNSYMRKGLQHHQVSPKGTLIFFKSEIIEFLKKYKKVGIH